MVSHLTLISQEFSLTQLSMFSLAEHAEVSPLFPFSMVLMLLTHSTGVQVCVDSLINSMLLEAYLLSHVMEAVAIRTSKLFASRE